MAKKDKGNPLNEGECQIALFQEKPIRRIFHKGEWWFSVVDVIGSLVETNSPSRYWTELRQRLVAEGAKGIFDKIENLKMEDAGGRMFPAEGIRIEDIFRLLQSIPSTKAEPFKKWLAKVGYERIQEIQNPEIAIKRAIAIYKAKGYDDGWIDARIRNVYSRKTLTDEWQKRGVQDKQYAMLTDAIIVETFSVTTKKYKEIKGLKGQSLRDNMTPIELTLTTLGEQTATEITRARNAKGFAQNFDAAKRGGRIAGDARKNIEEEIGHTVVSKENYLTEKQRQNNQMQLPATFDETMRRLLNVPKKPSSDQ